MSVLSDDRPVPPFLIDPSFNHAWLERGVAVLGEDGYILEMNAALTDWLQPDASTSTAKSLWALLAQRFPEWEQPLKAFCQPAPLFGHLLLPVANREPKQWFSLETVRHHQGWVVRLNSSLPPLSELAEGTWDEYMTSESACRDMFVRLLRTEAQLDNVVHRWPGVIFSQRADFSFHFISPQIQELTGVPANEWNNQPNLFWQVIHESDAEELKKQIKQAARTSGRLTATYRVKNLRTGRVSYILENRQVILTKGHLVLGYEGVWLDVTRQTIAEKRLSTAAWKETLAVLTMGLAHDFSNVMAGIHSLSESFLTQVDSQHPFHEGLVLIKQNSIQASQLVQRIINLHHGKTGECNYYDLNEIITDLVELGRKIIPRRIEVKIQLSPTPLPLYLDVVEFRQVIINLVLNAADAMAQKGELLFQTSLQREFPELKYFQGQLPRLPCVCLAVQDNGCGIETRHMNSIFDPFFTTKAMDKGSGLGLYNARLFIEKHHGAISVDSALGTGTTFRIWLPLSDFTEGERSARLSDGCRRSLLLVGRTGKSIETTAEVLRLNGYHVVVTQSEDHAVDLINANEYPFVGVIALLEPNQSKFTTLLGKVRLLKQPLKVILGIIGCNQDELDMGCLRQADLVIAPDSSQEDILEELDALFGIGEKSDERAKPDFQ